MSDTQDKADKQFDPTPRRLEKAREEGNVFKSQDMTAITMLMTGSLILLVGTPFAFKAMQALFAGIFSASSYELQIGTATPMLREVAIRSSLILLPFMIGMLVAGVGVNVAQSGWNVTSKALKPKPERISPLKGLKKMFGAQGLFNVGKSLLKILIVGPVAYLTIRNAMPEVLMLPARSLPDVFATSTKLILILLGRLIGILVFLSILDFAFEKWRYKRDLKMSHKEIRDEQKESEGDPMMRVRRRQRAREMANRPRLDHAVLKADVVVTNPTHYAVALQYDPGDNAAPKVLVKGIRKRALRIKELALEHNIPTVEDRPLARALYNTVKEDEEIPEDLYPAVAAILAEIYRNSGKHGF
ncbi:MAG: flagellar biosynthesis protein FlhB [Rhodothermales bacterium]